MAGSRFANALINSSIPPVFKGPLGKVLDHGFSGSDADLVLFDAEAKHVISAATQHGNSDFTLFEGKALTGKVCKVMLRSELLVDGDSGLAGQGRTVRDAWRIGWLLIFTPPCAGRQQRADRSATAICCPMPVDADAAMQTLGQVTLDAGWRRNHTKWVLVKWQYKSATMLRCLRLLFSADLFKPAPQVRPHPFCLRCFRQAAIPSFALSTISCARSSNSTTPPLWSSGLTRSAISAGTAMSTGLTLRLLSLHGTAASIHPGRGSSARVEALIC